MKNFTILIKESFEIYKQKIRPILVLLLIFGIVAAILGGLLGGSMMFSALRLKDTGATEITNKALFFSPLVIGIFLVIGLWTIFIGFTFIILAVKPAGTKLKEIFQEAWKKFGQYLWVVILTGFFVILASLFLVIPGMIVAIYLSFYSYVFIIEGEKGMNALRRSWSLVKGNWWKVFGRLILLGIVSNIIFFLLSSIHSLLSTIFQFLFISFNIIFLYLIYQDLKKSKEIQIQTQ